MRLFSCKHPHDGSLPLPTFAGLHDCTIRDYGFERLFLHGLKPKNRLIKRFFGFLLLGENKVFTLIRNEPSHYV